LRQDLIAGGMSPGEAAKTYLGASKTGDVTPALIEKEWGDMKETARFRLRKQGINTIEDYVKYRMRGGPERPGGAASGPAAGGASSSGKVIDFGSIR
jgi:hypothetical protein